MIANQTLSPDLPPTVRRRVLPLAVTALLPLLIVCGGYWLLRTAHCPSWEHETQEFQPDNQNGQANWKTWPKPDLVLVVSGQMHGYYDPCGCSDPQYGGLVRRYNLIEAIKAKKWDVIGIDLGDLAQNKGIHEQNLFKYELSMKALSLMNYRAVGIGMNEMKMPLGNALAQAWEKDRIYPRPVTLTVPGNAKGEQLHDELNLRSYEIVDLGRGVPKVGVTSMMGPQMRDKIQGVPFLDNVDELNSALKAFAAARVELNVLLHHEYPKVDEKLNQGDKNAAIEKERRDTAEKCAQYVEKERRSNPKIPPIKLMVLLTDWETPPGAMHKLPGVANTHVIEVAHKGIWVGVVGVYRDKREGFRFQYQLVKLGPEWATPEDKKANHPVTKLIENYNNQLRDRKMLDAWPRSRHVKMQITELGKEGLKATYIGSDSCKACHKEEYAIWAKTPHFVATETLERLKHPAGRQYDPECMRCHTTGFENPSGYNDLVVDPDKWPKPNNPKPNAQAIMAHNAMLRGVGCESCHGPCSEHELKPKNADLYPLINPYGVAAKERLLAAQFERNRNDKQLQTDLQRIVDAKRGMSMFCQSCHDTENDVNWGKKGNDLFDKWHLGKANKYPPLVHRIPKRDPLLNAPAGVDKKGPELKKGEPPIVIEILEKK